MSDIFRPLRGLHQGHTEKVASYKGRAEICWDDFNKIDCFVEIWIDLSHIFCLVVEHKNVQCSIRQLLLNFKGETSLMIPIDFY